MSKDQIEAHIKKHDGKAGNYKVVIVNHFLPDDSFLDKDIKGYYKSYEKALEKVEREKQGFDIMDINLVIKDFTGKDDEVYKLIDKKDTVETTKNYCDFGEEKVYILMALARKNENKNLTKNTEIVFREIVKKESDLKRKINKIRTLCNRYTGSEEENPVFRLYMSVNARDTVKGYWNFRNRMNDWIRHYMNGDEASGYKLKKIDSHWMSELQRPENRAETLFLFDIDRPDKEITWFSDRIKKHTKIKTIRETPNGFHIISEPFNYNELSDEFRENIEGIKTDDMLFLEYIR